MIVLHARWSADATLDVWGEEGAPVAPKRRSPSGRRTASSHPPHPFAASAASVGEAIEIACGDLLPDAAEATELTVLLPTAARAPLPSPRLIFDAPVSSLAAAADGVRLEPWVVPAISLSAGDALELLLALSRIEIPDVPLVALGDSVRYWIEVALRAVGQVAQGRFVPVLERSGDQFDAAWRPAPGGEMATWFAPLAAAMPPICRATLDSGVGENGTFRGAGGRRLRRGADDESAWSGFTGPPPQLVLSDAVAELLDAAVCRAIQGQPLPSRRGRRANAGQAAGERWLAALGGGEATLQGDPRQLALLKQSLDAWVAPLTAAAAGAAFRTCFRLTPPLEEQVARAPRAARNLARVSPDFARADDADDDWRLDIFLQATDDPSLLVPAETIWSVGSDRLRLLEHCLEDPQERLLADLGRALRLYPELEPALRSSRPASLPLDRAGAHRFLAEGSPLLEQAGFGVIVPDWWRKRSGGIGLKLVTSSKNAGSGAGLMGLDGLCAYEWRVALGDDELDIGAFRALAKLKVPLVRVLGQWVELDPARVEAALRLVEGTGAAGEMTALDAIRLAVGAQDGPAGLPVNSVEAGGWLGELLNGQENGAVARDLASPASFEGALRPYQERGLAWLAFLDRLGIGGCLADDMGLGKTPQALALLALERDAAGNGGSAPDGHRPTLLICPMSLVGNWQREAARFVPGLRVHVHHGAERASGEQFRTAVAAADLVITTYAIATRDRDELAGMRWGRLMLDEAQNIKNPSAKQTLAIRSIPAARRVALTGTPVENRLGELWSIFNFLNPGLLGSETGFRRRFAIPIERYNDEDTATLLRRITRPFILRRLKTDRTIIADLPEKVEMTVLCNLTREQASLYQVTVDEMLERIAASEGMERRGLVLATMTRLKQVCNHPAQLLRDRRPLDDRSGKLARLDDLLEGILTLGERALVFTQYAEMAALLQPHLRSRFGREVLYLHGGTPRKERDVMLERFASSNGPPIFLLSLKAGGTGLNLVAANHVIHFDRWWNPAVEDQATDRAYRIGQGRDVQVRKLVCVGTLEERIDRLIQEKRDLADRIVGSGEAWLTELSTNELRDLVRLSADAVAE